ncbi:MAG: helix-turn-helix transcriptional regulator [Bacteroidota bacterium]
MKEYTLDQIKDRFIGEPGTFQREAYEIELKIELIGDMIKRVRKQRNLTQSELGELIGVKKAQISKLENSTHNVSIGTILKVFEALKAKVKLNIQLQDQQIEIV